MSWLVRAQPCPAIGCVVKIYKLAANIQRAKSNSLLDTSTVWCMIGTGNAWLKKIC